MYRSPPLTKLAKVNQLGRGSSCRSVPVRCPKSKIYLYTALDLTSVLVQLFNGRNTDMGSIPVVMGTPP